MYVLSNYIVVSINKNTTLSVSCPVFYEEQITLESPIIDITYAIGPTCNQGLSTGQ